MFISVTELIQKSKELRQRCVAQRLRVSSKMECTELYLEQMDSARLLRKAESIVAKAS